MKAALAAAAVALATPLFAHAQPVSEAAGPDTYLQVHLGALLPGGSFDRLETGYTVGGVFGARFSRHLAVEGGIAWERITTGGADPTTLTDAPISAALVARLPFKRAELAAYAGPELHLLRLTEPPAIVGGSRQSWRAVAFGGHYGVRAALNVWPTTLVGVDVGATFAEARLDRSRSVGGVRLAMTLQYRF